MHQPTLYIALPVMNEEAIISDLLQSISAQSFPKYKLYACLNQPEAWWDDEAKKELCESNVRVLSILKEWGAIVIDRCSRGNGWPTQTHGVGWARKVAMDAINEVATDNDIILSMDADTTFEPNYFASVVKLISQNPKCIGLSNPYYHKLSGDDKLDRALLRYEIYMRCYAINMWHTNSPYTFTALGSAIALPVWAYRKAGGITPKKSGEDFYLLQKLRKAGRLITWNSETVYPATRYSDRVFFGTGPALIKGSTGDWESYPIYHHSLFDEVKKTYDFFPKLFVGDVATPMDTFIETHFKEENIWQPLRSNTKTEGSFIAACHQKIDGLRLLQYLKWRAPQLNISNEKAMADFFNHFYPEGLQINEKTFNFQTSPINELSEIRDFLVKEEKECQHKDFIDNFTNNTDK